MKHFQGKIADQKYSLTIKPACERTTREPGTCEAKIAEFHKAIIIVSDADNDVTNIIERDYSPLSPIGPHCELLQVECRYIRADMREIAGGDI